MLKGSAFDHAQLESLSSEDESQALFLCTYPLRGEFIIDRPEPGDVLTSSTELTLRCCPWWHSKSCPFYQPWPADLSDSCLKEERSN